MDDLAGKANDPELARYRTLRSSPAFKQALELDERLRDRRPMETRLVWHSDSASAYAVGAGLSALDREMRRAAVIVGSWREDQPLPRPLPEKLGRLEIANTAPGSFEAVLSALGSLESVLLSSPVQLLLTVKELLSSAVHIRAWLGKKRGEPEGEPTVTLRTADGTKATGQRIILERSYPDGTFDRLIVE